MTDEERREFNLSRFADHRKILGNGTKAMSEGDLTQALPVATSIRVLVHESRMSKPLLKELRDDYWSLQIYDTPIPQQAIDSMPIYLPIPFQLTADSVTFSLKFPKEIYRPVSLEHWWTRKILVIPEVGRLSRRDVILGLANKEGAHVDSNLDPQYEKLLWGHGVNIQSGNGQVSLLNVSRFMAGKAALQLLDSFETNFDR